VVATLTKSVKVCVLRLTPDKLYFVVVERGTVGGVNVWCELSQVSLDLMSLCNPVKLSNRTHMYT